MPVSLALFFTLCYVFNWTLFNIGLAWLLSHLFQLLVFRRWGLDYLKLNLEGPPTPLQTFFVTRLQRFIRITWPAIIFILAITWLVGKGKSSEYFGNTDFQRLDPLVYVILGGPFPPS